MRSGTGISDQRQKRRSCRSRRTLEACIENPQDGLLVVRLRLEPRLMKRLVQIVEQIHEAGRLLSLESAPHARMSLLLLDNAIEFLMHRAVTERFHHDDFYSRLFEQAKASLPAD